MSAFLSPILPVNSREMHFSQILQLNYWGRQMHYFYDFFSLSYRIYALGHLLYLFLMLEENLFHWIISLSDVFVPLIFNESSDCLAVVTLKTRYRPNNQSKGEEDKSLVFPQIKLTISHKQYRRWWNTHWTNKTHVISMI